VLTCAPANSIHGWINRRWIDASDKVLSFTVNQIVRVRELLT
jgi:hypothetical protein